jgi:hypothetical protein
VPDTGKVAVGGPLVGDQLGVRGDSAEHSQSVSAVKTRKRKSAHFGGGLRVAGNVRRDVDVSDNDRLNIRGRHLLGCKIFASA